jgi:hypothetical protein
MTFVAGVVTRKLESLLRGEAGVQAALSVISDLESIDVPPFHGQQVIAQNASPELAERSTVNKYPVLFVYCSKLANLLREKFRRFSGEAHMTVEVRVSQDRLDELEARVQMYVDAVIRVLDQSRGDWGDGVFYAGTYEVSYGPVKHGGRNFIQIAKVAFAVDISVS